MSQRPPRRRSRTARILLAAAFGLGAAALLWLPGPGHDGRAQADEPLRANSVCEAHALKALQAENPGLQIEIPPEYDRQFPSAAACESHDEAWDPEVPGPNQPIPFSHAHHAGLWEIECMYCHTGTDVSQAAGVPSVELCMGCHSHFPAEYDELEGIRILKQYWEEKKPIPWVQIHRVPEHVQFRHNRHVQAGVDCARCHGNVAEMEKIWLEPDTVWWQWGLPSAKLEMGWCIQCHRDNEVSQDCFTCHY